MTGSPSTVSLEAAGVHYGGERHEPGSPHIVLTTRGIVYELLEAGLIS